jgi:hypothetical protein
MQHMKHTKNKTPNTHKQKTNEHTNNKPTCLASASKDNGKSKNKVCLWEPNNYKNMRSIWHDACTCAGLNKSSMDKELLLASLSVVSLWCERRVHAHNEWLWVLIGPRDWTRAGVSVRSTIQTPMAFGGGAPPSIASTDAPDDAGGEACLVSAFHIDSNTHTHNHTHDHSHNHTRRRAHTRTRTCACICTSACAYTRTCAIKVLCWAFPGHSPATRPIPGHS